MSDGITDEMVEVAAKALYEVEWLCRPGQSWEKADDGDRPYWRQSARAALEAALPLIVEAERARQAEMDRKWLNRDALPPSLRSSPTDPEKTE